MRVLAPNHLRGTGIVSGRRGVRSIFALLSLVACRRPDPEFFHGHQTKRFPFLREGPEEYFTGAVCVDPLFEAPDPARVRGAQSPSRLGRAPPGTLVRSARRVVTSGLGWVQREGGPVGEIRPGDVVWFPPGEKHWHGATPAMAMTHIAIQEALNGKVVDWMEQVNDEQYRSN